MAVERENDAWCIKVPLLRDFAKGEPPGMMDQRAEDLQDVVAKIPGAFCD